VGAHTGRVDEYRTAPSAASAARPKSPTPSAQLQVTIISIGDSDELLSIGGSSSEHRGQTASPSTRWIVPAPDNTQSDVRRSARRCMPGRVPRVHDVTPSGHRAPTRERRPEVVACERHCESRQEVTCRRGWPTERGTAPKFRRGLLPTSHRDACDTNLPRLRRIGRLARNVRPNST
jgi:hypothetical protein